MPDDLKIIKQLEKRIGRGLKERGVNEIMGFKRNGFSINEKGQVIGLNLCEIKLTSPTLEILSTFHHLKILDLHSTGITDISSLQGLSNLMELYLYKNKITDISSLQRLGNLTYLDLSYNQITDIPSPQGLSNLTYLYLSYNQITEISPLQGLSQLKVLDLIDNKIKQLPENILELGLDIDVDSRWVYVNTTAILLGENPLEKPPIEIIRQCKSAIWGYFKSLEGKK